MPTEQAKTPADTYELAPDSEIDALEALSGTVPDGFDVLDHIEQLKIHRQYKDQTPAEKRLLSRDMREFFGVYARMVWDVCDLYWDAQKTGAPEKMQEAHRRGWALLDNLTKDFGEHSDQRTEAILLLHATARGRYSVFNRDMPLDEEIRELAEGDAWVEREMRPEATGGAAAVTAAAPSKQAKKGRRCVRPLRKALVKVLIDGGETKPANIRKRLIKFAQENALPKAHEGEFNFLEELKGQKNVEDDVGFFLKNEREVHCIHEKEWTPCTPNLRGSQCNNCDIWKTIKVLQEFTE
jgi:hypothetical protein